MININDVSTHIHNSARSTIDFQNKIHKDERPQTTKQHF